MKPGDKVTLKSGGPIMVVASISAGWVLCRWANVTTSPMLLTDSSTACYWNFDEQEFEEVVLELVQ